MKFSKKILPLIASSTFVFSTSIALANNTVTPSTLKLTGYQLWASTSTDCSNPIKVIDNGSAGKEVDIATSTDFGSATLPPNGTYVCLIAVVSDTYTIVPAITGTTAAGGTANDLCIAGNTYTQDTCGTGVSSVLPDGTTTTCATGRADKVASYISTAGTAGADGDAAHPKLLNSSIVISGASTSKTLFVSNPDGLVNQSGSCGQNSGAVVGVR